MMLHAGAPIAPHDVWQSWSTEPWVVASIGVTVLVYARGAREIWKRSSHGRSELKREILCFLVGIALLLIALVSPLHQLGGVLFSAHMTQHELLMTLAAPLLILGQPLVPMLFALPSRARKGIGKVVATRAVKASWSVLTAPLVAWVLHAAAIWVWHAPSLYDASVASEGVHALQHASFLGTALVFWWVVLRDIRAGAGAGLAVLLLFTTALHTTLLGALITMADAPLYGAYATTTAPWGMSAIDDQQLGGIIMWVPGGIAYLAAALILFLRWMRMSGERVAHAERRRRDAVRSPRLRRAVVLLVLMLGACSTNNEESAAELTGGNPHDGRAAIRRYGCQSCHSIPGVQGAVASVGPPLSGIANRSYIAGVLTNTPDHMIEWLRNPPGIDDKTAMPNLDVTEKDARNIAAYLYTLR